MRRTILTAALLAGGAAYAQPQTECRGETLSALNECLAAATPEAPESAEVPEAVDDTTRVTPRPVERTTMGGALQPRNLRAEPPRAGGATGAATQVPTMPTARSDAARSPLATYYGSAGRAAEVPRAQVPRSLYDLPGTLDTR